MWWIWHSAKRPPTLRPGQTTRAVSPPVGCQKPHPPSPFIIITQPESWYSFYHPTEGRRLSRPRHCSKGALHSPCPRLYIVVMFTINMQLPTVGFEPRSSHTAVRHVTARPLRPLDIPQAGYTSCYQTICIKVFTGKTIHIMLLNIFTL